MIISPVCRAEFAVVETLENSTRNDGGFGHTGI